MRTAALCETRRREWRARGIQPSTFRQISDPDSNPSRRPLFTDAARSAAALLLPRVECLEHLGPLVDHGELPRALAWLGLGFKKHILLVFL